jgi:integrase
VVVWRHRGKQHKEFFASYAEAREAKGRRQAGDRRRPARIKVREYAPRWIVAYRGRTRRGFDEDTRRLYRTDIEKRIVSYFGDWWLDDVAAEDIREWFSWLEDRGVSESGIRRAKATAQVMFATAAEDGKVRANPMSGVRYVPREQAPPKPKPRGLTLDELGRFMAVVPEQSRLLFTVLAHTGIRVGELIGLKWEHVHLGDDPCMRVQEQVAGGRRKPRPKSHHGIRSIPLSPELAAALAQWKRESAFNAPGDPVFSTEVGTELDYANLRREVLRPAIAASGIDWPKGVAFHMFRKTAASQLHHAGKSGRQLATWLGHHDPAFTIKTYVGDADEGLGDAAFLDELMPPRGNTGATRHPRRAGKRRPRGRRFRHESGTAGSSSNL